MPFLESGWIELIFHIQFWEEMSSMHDLEKARFGSFFNINIVYGPTMFVHGSV